MPGMAGKTRADFKEPQFEVALAKELKKKFPKLDIYQDDFGHANYGVYIQLTGDVHAGAYALLSETDENWTMGVYTTDNEDGVYFVDFQELPYARDYSDKRVKNAPDIARIVEVVSPKIEKALGMEYKVKRPKTADLAVALKGVKDERGRAVFIHSGEWDKQPSNVFAMLDDTRVLKVWLEKGKWAGKVEDINHKDWKGVEVNLVGLSEQDETVKLAAQVGQAYEETKENLAGILANWKEHRDYMVELGLDPDAVEL